ncbi:Glyoxalase/bleomycin resistance protein/dioxygenase [Shewanella halifaxensis HAW-EB4]|uniref:Glyoxalase/bleomycin resistance protein/dioxygenase n=1 Tax=Shewanella halifaxensis (strain HAW-EB4) TaxID=458817 RepID=B0TPV8_SHEHH|nr:VOC family protein [Shewanella halifaxensis]ABZ76237.1 Glyoxalase/bleomycin resistance protein/dioxygenase [Shewanella halifaxensis HAW-EB4]
MHQHHSINYLEIPVKEIDKTKAFFNQVFGWEFIDYGPDYSCFVDVGITGGFFVSDKSFTTNSGCPLIVIYSKDLEASQTNVVQAGGDICKAIFSFPGGRRFHFLDPNGNEYAVWSE